MAAQELTKEYLLEKFDYIDGELYWKNPSCYRLKNGDIAGGVSGKGRLSVRLNWKRYQVHRLIFMMHHGYMPKIVDHADGDFLNNRIENLREATEAQNGYNKRASIRNTSGLKNVSWCKPRKKWVVMIWVDKIPKYIGGFADIELAELVAIEAREKHHGAFANHGGAF